MRTTFLALLLVLVGSVPALADGDAGTRYHDAYVMEVIEGKIADAAKSYLALMEDEQTPARIKVEARFRFAVCTVLLGRSDEARAQLDELLRMKDLPDVVRTRAETYRKSLSDVGLGTEIEKKLQSLVFELAKAKGINTVPGVYREFEVIGTAAIPFLRKLLKHPDAMLRFHAFRLLLRMRAPGVIDAWTPRMTVSREVLRELRAYFHRFPAAHGRFEARVLALGKPAIHAMAAVEQWNATSVGFLEAFVAKGGSKALATLWAAAMKTPAADSLIVKLAGDEDEATRKAVLQAISTYAVARPVAADLFPRALDVAIQELKGKRRYTFDLTRWAKHLPSGALLDALERLEQERGALEAALRGRPVYTNYRPAAFERSFLENLARHELSPEQYERLFAFLRGQMARARPATEVSATLRAIRSHVRSAPEDQALAFVAWLFDPARNNSKWWNSFFGRVETEREFALLATAARIAPEDQRWAMLELLPVVRAEGALDEGQRRQLALVLELLPTLPASGVSDAARMIAARAHSADAKTRTSILDQLFVLSQKLDRAEQHVVQGSVLLANHDEPYFVEVGRPYAEAKWTDLTSGARGRALTAAIGWIKWNETPTEHKPALRAFVLRHKDELSVGQVSSIAGAVEGVMQYAEWVPLVPWNYSIYRMPQFNNSLQAIPTERADEIAHAVVAATELTDSARARSVIAFAITRPSNATRRAYADRFLALEEPALRAFMIERLETNGAPASPEAVEKALQALLEAPVPAWRMVEKLLMILVRERPTTALLPAVERLLASGDQRAVNVGIAAAASLGSKTVLPALKKLLSSMDQNIRRSAKNAIDEIDALVKLRSTK